MQDNTPRILQYLRYLRDVSRKIVTRNSFEKCYLNKQNRYAHQIHRYKQAITTLDAEYETFNWYYEQTKSNHDKKLFYGFGLICGNKQKKAIAGPMLYVQCDIDKSDDNTIVVAFSETPNINYDLIASISDKSSAQDEDVFTPSTTNQTVTLERLEDEIARQYDYKSLVEFAPYMLTQLRIDFDEFRQIELQPQSIDFKAEVNIHLSNKLQSIFRNKLKFFQTNFAFVADIPDQLSTYQALHSFVENLDQKEGFKNPVLEKLLINALSSGRAPINSATPEKIDDIIENFIPLSLSSSQKQAIKNAWSNEISYIQGPPGTGKSHTISAILLSALALNKRVLVVSQKQPALEVVNQKINPILSDEEDISGILYFDKESRKKIKEYVSRLANLAHNKTALFQKWMHLDANIKEQESVLNKKTLELKKYESLLVQNLRYQQEYKEKNDILRIEIDRFTKHFAKLPLNHPFKIISSPQSYEAASNTVKRIYNSTKKTLSSALYLKKYQQHLSGKFNVPDLWFTQSNFQTLSEKFVELNLIYTETEKVKNQITNDETSLRVLIKDLKIDLERTKTTLIKLRYKFRFFRLIQDRSIVEDLEQFGRMMHWTNSKIVQKRMQEINFLNIVNLFPFWTAEIRNLGQLFPLQHGLFDLIIVDEASQVNLAEILPAFYRGTNICIVGDHNQLNLKATGLSFGLSSSFDEKIWNKYNGEYVQYAEAIDKCLVVKKSSILDFIRSDYYNVRISEVMLEEHFRSLPQLAKYTSKTFYKDENNPKNTEGKLKIMTETPDKIALQCFKGYFVDGVRDTVNNNKVIIKEVDTTISLLRFLVRTSRNENELFGAQFDFPQHINKEHFSVGIISMIRDQCELIKEKLSESFSEDELTKHQVMVGTPEEFQGSERDIIIFTLCLDETCKGHGHFQDKQRLNVATSRAKSFTYFIYSRFPQSFDKIYSYAKSMGCDLSFAQQENEIEIRGLPEFNPTKLESDFERHVYDCLNNYVQKVNRSNNNITLHNQIVSCGQKRLDFVLFNQQSKKSVAVEVDGSYHFNSGGLKQNYTEEHLERMEILQRAGWKIINTPYYKWYKNGWLSETSDPKFQEELKRIHKELDNYLFAS